MLYISPVPLDGNSSCFCQLLHISDQSWDTGGESRTTELRKLARKSASKV